MDKKLVRLSLQPSLIWLIGEKLGKTPIISLNEHIRVCMAKLELMGTVLEAGTTIRNGKAMYKKLKSVRYRIGRYRRYGTY